MTAANLVYIIPDDNHAAIVIGRLLMSLAHGMVFVTVITHAGENASKNMRGTILSTINCMLYTAIFISIIITGSIQINAFEFPVNFSSERIHGIIALVFLVASIICTITMTVETVPFLLMKNRPNMATVNMKHLRDVDVSSEIPHITREMEELTLMIIQDKQDNSNPLTNGNVKPLLMMIVIRLLVTLTNNFLLNYLLISFCEVIIYHWRLAALLLVTPRLAMSIGQVFYADLLGRKLHIIISTVLAGLTMIGLGIVINVVEVSPDYHYYIPAIFSIFFQLCCSIGIDQMADVYLSEAFSTAKKSWSISLVMSVEHVFHIFMIGMAFTQFTAVGSSVLIFMTGIFIIIFGITLLFTLPETRRTTLKQARDLFRDENIFKPLEISSPYA